ncbi:MAG TPA: hypothetical protein VFH39_02460 [Candidatus Saccharimonadales bacterium]|jgi:phytol kinase|nr:hypothetical protein [Candidatus Saccharimonadales bacterium]
MPLVFTVAAVLTLLLANEWWWRRSSVHGELGRKFVHITVGTFVAFWPYYLSWNQIRFMSVAFLLVVGLSKYFNIFRAIHSVTRPTLGELYFGLAVGLTTFVTDRPALYAAALLQMSLADGLAAVIGVRFGRGNGYRVLGALKSLAGSGTFLLTSYVILLSLSVFSTHLAIPYCLGIAVAAAVLENVGLRGLDNLLVPLFVAGMLRLLV